jgi:hypothetical protein
MKSPRIADLLSSTASTARAGSLHHRVWLLCLLLSAVLSCQSSGGDTAPVDSADAESDAGFDVGDAQHDAASDAAVDAQSDATVDAQSDATNDVVGDAAIPCESVCVEWAGPALAIDSLSTRKGPLRCDGPDALHCPSGTECVEESQAFGAGDFQGAVCEVRESPLRFDVAEPEAAVDVELALTVNGQSVDGATDEEGELVANGYRIWVQSALNTRDAWYDVDAASGVARMRLAPGVYTVQVDDGGCGPERPFIHRQASLTVATGGEAVLDVDAVGLSIVAEVDGEAVEWGQRGASLFGLSPGRGAYVEGLGGAACLALVWSDNLVMVQSGTVQLSVSVHLADLFGIVGPESIGVAQGDAAVVLSGDSAEVGQLLELPRGWEPNLTQTLSLERDSGMVFTQYLRNEARVIRGVYQARYAAAVFPEQGWDRMFLNVQWSSLSLPAETALPLRPTEVNVQTAYSPRESDYLVAEYGDDMQVRMDRRSSSEEWESYSFIGLVPNSPARLYLVPSSSTNGRPRLAPDVPTLLLDDWMASDEATLLELSARRYRFRFPGIDTGSIRAAAHAEGDPFVRLRFSRQQSETTRSSIVDLIAERLEFHFGPEESVDPTVFAREGSVAVWVNGHDKAYTASVELTATGNEHGIPLLPALEERVEYVVGDQVVRSVETSGQRNASVPALWWEPSPDEPGAVQARVLLAERLVYVAP